MTLQEVVLKSQFDDMYNCLIENYEKCRAVNKERMIKGYSQLQSLPIDKDNDELIITIGVSKEEGEKFYDVSGYSSDEDTLYSLVLTEWEIWLGLEVDSNLFETMSHSEITAHCYWEMTWQGWTVEERAHNIEIDMKETNICDELEKYEEAFMRNRKTISDKFLNRLIEEYEKAETDNLKAGIEIIVEHFIKAALVTDNHIELVLEAFSEDEDITEAIKNRNAQFFHFALKEPNVVHCRNDV